MNDENQITTTFAKNDTPKLIKLAVLGIAAVVFIIALTMKLVPWGSQTAAGILLGLSALCMVTFLPAIAACTVHTPSPVFSEVDTRVRPSFFSSAARSTRARLFTSSRMPTSCKFA